jgi:hypothetical protein
MDVIGFCGGSHCEAGHAERLHAAGCNRTFATMSEVHEFLRLSP